MKRIFTIAAVLAIAHLVGLIGAFGWLLGTGRVSAERVERLRELFGESVAAEQARLEAEAAAAEAGLAEAETPLPGTLPVSSELAVNYSQEQSRAAEFQVQRQSRASEDLARTLQLERERLDRQRKEFDSERDAFLAMRGRLEAVEGEEQFEKAVGVLKTVSPKAARGMLQAIIDGASGPAGGSQPGGMEQAVAYLNRLPSITQGEIMAQFAKDAPEVAAELLERLRTHGLVAAPSGEQDP